MNLKYTPGQERAAAAMYKQADKHHDKLTRLTKREVMAMYKLGQHIELGNLKAARAILQNNKRWMDIPASVWKILYPEDYRA